DLTLEPTGRLWIVGLNAEMMFFRGTLDWLGLEPQFIQIGRFKGAAEPLTDTEPSEELVAEVDQLLDDLYGQLCSQIATQRRLTVEAVAAAINEGPFHGASAQEHRLIDRQLNRRDWRQYVTDAETGDGGLVWADNFGAGAGPQVDLTNPFALLATLTGPPPRPRQDPTIAVVHVDGVILGGASGQGLFGQRVAGARTLTRVLADMEEDPRIRAVVLRVNSPGGSAIASELIYQAVEQCARVKPVIVSVSAVAASGGYYVSVGAPTIVADPAAMIGSIGVVSGKLALTGLFDNIGISTYQATRGRNAGLMFTRPWTEEEMELVRADAQRTYDVFVARVQASRGERLADIDTVAEGRVFTARRAVELGLIDRIGTLNDAVALAMEAADVSGCDVITLPKPRGLLDMLTGGADASLGSILPNEASIVARLIARHHGAVYLLNLAELLTGEHILTAMPMHITIR
ncbi:MAG: signal peptide peptidase SppA, partial [Planctomycetota bacterium]